MNLPSELWIMALTTEFARANNDYEVFKTFKTLLCFQGLSMSCKID